MRFLLAFILLSVFLLKTSYADDNAAPNQDSFPFDQPCLKYDQANFKTGTALLEVMKQADFPQYCVLYSLSNYQVKEKNDEGYLITGSNSNPETTTVLLKSDKPYKPDQSFTSSDNPKPSGQWAYFIRTEELAQGNGTTKEIYVFQEIDF